MASSATVSLRDAKRRDTEHRISDSAQRLADERGLDGFTMDDLATAAEVSRRTLFNYFPSKLDAVLGTVPALADETRAVFVAGGPHGDLVADLAVLGREVLEDRELDRAHVERVHRLMTGTPRLLVAVHGRFEEICTGFVDLVRERDPGLDPMHARLLVRLLVTVFDSAMAAYVAGDDRPLADLFDAHISAARDLLG